MFFRNHTAAELKIKEPRALFNSFKYRAEKYKSLLQLGKLQMKTISKLPVIPPWENIATFVKQGPMEEVTANFNFNEYVSENCPDFKKFFTDGSKILERNKTSVASAVYSAETRTTIC